MRTDIRWSRPTARPRSVSFNTRSVRARSVSQFPICDMSWSAKNSRKFRTPRERKVSRPPPHQPGRRAACMVTRRGSLCRASNTIRRCRSGDLALAAFAAQLAGRLDE